MRLYIGCLFLISLLNSAFSQCLPGLAVFNRTNSLVLNMHECNQVVDSRSLADAPIVTYVKARNNETYLLMLLESSPRSPDIFILHWLVSEVKPVDNTLVTIPGGHVLTGRYFPPVNQTQYEFRVYNMTGKPIWDQIPEQERIDFMPSQWLAKNRVYTGPLAKTLFNVKTFIAGPPGWVVPPNPVGIPNPHLPVGPQPSYPAGQQPPYPAGQQPPYPAGQQPPYPTAQQPPYPAGQLPPYPAGQQPPYPTGQQPPYPAGQLPPYPAGQQPPYPAGQQPPHPMGQQPVYPGSTTITHPNPLTPIQHPSQPYPPQTYYPTVQQPVVHLPLHNNHGLHFAQKEIVINNTYYRIDSPDRPRFNPLIINATLYTADTNLKKFKLTPFLIVNNKSYIWRNQTHVPGNGSSILINGTQYVPYNPAKEVHHHHHYKKNSSPSYSASLLYIVMLLPFLFGALSS